MAELKAGTRRPKDGIQWVKDDHEVLRQLFAAYFRADEAKDLAGMRSGCDALIQQISAHASAEERYLYPLYKDKMGEVGKALYERSVTDDNINKEALELLEKLDPERDGFVWSNTMQKMKTVVLGHLDDEEPWLDKLRSYLKPQELAELEDNLEVARKNAPTHPHARSGPTHALPAKLMHPIAGAMDRAADKVLGTAHATSQPQSQPQPQQPTTR